jgi:hypothetical protein
MHVLNIWLGVRSILNVAQLAVMRRFGCAADNFPRTSYKKGIQLIVEL